ncbi:MAG: acyl-CoA dehydrogenase family protein [Burkholderiaceae bacterium]
MNAITEKLPELMGATQEDLAIAADPSVEDMLTRVRTIANRDLAPIVRQIDADGLYPEDVMRTFGSAGAYQGHLPRGAATDLNASIAAMTIAGEHCLSTAFCMWCQSALGWYVFNSDNETLKVELGERLASGELLGGTGLSNPMKTFFGIEKMNLKGTVVDGGYTISGRLPWVSNLGPGHLMAVVFEVPEQDNKRVMAVVEFDADGVVPNENDSFVALGGTRTYGLFFKNAFISHARVLADPIDAYLKRIRAGFILLQSGMAFGMVRSCVDLMLKMRQPLGHVNQYLDVQPEALEEQLLQLQAKVTELAATPYDDSKDYFIEVVRARLHAGELAVQAAHHAMLHSGARGYVSNGVAQRRLREAYFCAIVTPATKQLRKMLSDLGANP